MPVVILNNQSIDQIDVRPRHVRLKAFGLSSFLVRRTLQRGLAPHATGTRREPGLVSP